MNAIVVEHLSKMTSRNEKEKKRNIERGILGKKKEDKVMICFIEPSYYKIKRQSLLASSYLINHTINDKITTYIQDFYNSKNHRFTIENCHFSHK
jgi:hypothetical protein